jgi:hypothetical protein
MYYLETLCVLPAWSISLLPNNVTKQVFASCAQTMHAHLHAHTGMLSWSMTIILGCQTHISARIFSATCKISIWGLRSLDIDTFQLSRWSFCTTGELHSSRNCMHVCVCVCFHMCASICDGIHLFLHPDMHACAPCSDLYSRMPVHAPCCVLACTHHHMILGLLSAPRSVLLKLQHLPMPSPCINNGPPHAVCYE